MLHVKPTTQKEREKLVFKTLWNWIKGAETEVEHIVAPLTHMVERLVKHADKKGFEAEKHYADAAASIGKGREAAQQATKATVAASNIGMLLQPATPAPVETSAPVATSPGSLLRHAVTLSATTEAPTNGQ